MPHSTILNSKNKKKHHILDGIFLALVFLIIAALSFSLWTQLIPLWTMNITTKAYDITTFAGKPLRVEIITDFDKLAMSKLAFDKILTLTLREKPDIVVFLNRTGSNGRFQKKLQSMFYLLSRFQIEPDRIFIIPDRPLYESLIGNTRALIYYVDFFKTIEAEVEFEGIEHVADTITFIMASSRERIEFLKGNFQGTIVFLADEPGEKAYEVVPEIFITTKVPLEFKQHLPPNLLVAKKGITFLNLY